MFKEVKVHATFNERTGYGIHASRFFPALDELMQNVKDGVGTVHISLLDSVSIQNVTERLPYPSILFNVWESTEQPQWFMDKLKFFDQLWVPSEWQRACSIAQGVPEEFVKVVPEGVDPVLYKPLAPSEHEKPFKFVHVGQWQPRKSTIEVIQAYIKAFPLSEDPMGLKTKLYLSVDTLFPSDTYKTTEERLEAYGLQDPRIVVVHFEERADYIRRLQNADCFVTCARSEGWGLPIIEAMACGIPTIVADWSGSTEYATDCIQVPIRKLIKPYGIYGNWDVPGQWCEPDFDMLAAAMKHAYDDYDACKKQALISAERIRKDFSWQAAAQKAFVHLEKLSAPNKTPIMELITPKKSFSKEDIIRYAEKHGFKIKDIEPIKSVFVVGCWPNSQEKMETLVETITQVKAYGFPVVISTHYALPPPVVEMVDYVLYEKKNVLSDDWRPRYWREANGQVEFKDSNIPYHGVACLNAIRNAVDFCYKKFDRMYYLEFDSEVDYDKVMEAVVQSDKPMTCINYEGKSIRTDVWSGEVPFLYERIPVVFSWSEYTKDMTNIYNDYPLEDYLFKSIGKENIHIFNLEIGNRYDQVDRNLWGDDLFSIHFNDGPFVNIAGISNREYDICYSAGGKNIYNVKQKVGMWSKASPKFYLPWTVTASIDGIEKFRHVHDLKGKRVLISMGSKALGDSIAWIPYVEEFRKKHGCHVICSGWWQEIFDYPDIEWVKPGAVVENVYSLYNVGCFDNQPTMNPTNWRECNLQKVAADILGLPFEPLKARLITGTSTQTGKPYICFSEYSTMKNKFWNFEGGWQAIVNYMNSLGYDCISVSAEPTALKNVISHNGQSIQNTIEDIKNCAFYIGLNHGPAWIAYALGKEVVMITGVSEEWNDFPNKYRIAKNHEVCGIGCFNDPAIPIERGFEWCPRGKDYICTKSITPEEVIGVIDKLIGDIGLMEDLIHAIKEREQPKNNKRKYKGNGGGKIDESRDNLQSMRE